MTLRNYKKYKGICWTCYMKDKCIKGGMNGSKIRRN